MRNKLLLTISCFIFQLAAINAQQGYSDLNRQEARLQALVKGYPQLTKLRSLVKTSSGKDIWQITIGKGNTESKPGIVIVGGTEGNYVLGSELAIGFAETLLHGSNTDSIRTLLARTSFYIFPNMSPDAMEQYFAPLKYERQGNAVSTDDDRDGKADEDGYDDLDGNGKIGWMRVVSPIGDYKPHPDDPRVLVKADITKGEKGMYQLYSEGLDNDKDGVFNEDGAGGVAFNRNLSYKHPSFTPGSGEYPVSEKETRALLDYLYELYNVYAVISFGSNNNLSTPFTFNSSAATQTIVTGWLEPDTKVNALVSELYNKTINAKDGPKSTAGGGDLLSWAYFHYGRYSFSTPGWWVPKTKPDSTRNEKAFTQEDAGANYLRWAGQQGINNNFTTWKQIQHPDFPGQVVEVGGIDPFAQIVPPYSLVPELVKKNTEFLVRLAGYQPELDIVNVKTEKIGDGLTRITVEVVNKGALASHTKLGERSYWVKRIQVKLNLQKSQSIISGRRIQLLNSLEGYGSEKLSWLIKGPGKLEIEAGSPTTGTKTLPITL